MPSGRTIRLRYDIDQWLSSIDANLAIALNIVKAGYISHNDLIAKLENIELQIESLKKNN